MPANHPFTFGYVVTYLEGRHEIACGKYETLEEAKQNTLAFLEHYPHFTVQIARVAYHALYDSSTVENPIEFLKSLLDTPPRA